MINKNSRLAIILAIFFEIIVINTLITSIISKRWDILSFSILFIVCFTLPFVITYIANKKKIVLPNGFQLVVLLFLFLAQYLGEIKHFYTMFWWWDVIIHAIFGCYSVIVLFHIINFIFKKRNEVTVHRFVLFLVIFTFCFSIALGALWEIFEFSGDYLFKTEMIKGGLEDTIIDLISDVLAAFITSIVYYFYGIKKYNSQ